MRKSVRRSSVTGRTSSFSGARSSVAPCASLITSAPEYSPAGASSGTRTVAMISRVTSFGSATASWIRSVCGFTRYAMLPNPRLVLYQTTWTCAGSLAGRP